MTSCEEGAADVGGVVGDAGLRRHDLRLAVDQRDRGVDGASSSLTPASTSAASLSASRSGTSSPPSGFIASAAEKSRGCSWTGESPKTSVTGPDMAGLANVVERLLDVGLVDVGLDRATVSSSATASSSAR